MDHALARRRVPLHPRLARLRWFVALGAVAALLAAWVSACSPEPGQACAGGIVIDGECRAKCDPSKCLEQNVCVENECRLMCDAHTDCYFDIQSCVAAVEDDSGRAVQVCMENGRSPVVGGLDFGTPCPFGHECAPWACPSGVICDPNACAGVPQDCVLDQQACGDDPWCNRGTCAGSGEPCTATTCEPTQCGPVTACPDGLQCDPNACEGRPDDCEPDLQACEGKTRCNIGKCAGSGAWCRVTTCPPSECQPFFCKTTGPGDLDAYCTKHDCSADDDCPAGYTCGVTRDPHDICGNTCDGGTCSHSGNPCDVDSDCQKGNSPFCGETTEPCIEPADFDNGGAQYFEGSVCLLRRTCLKRPPCVACETNLDCSRIDEQLCVDFGGERVCARFCSTEADCFGDETCIPSPSTCAGWPGVTCEGAGDCPPVGKCFEERCVPGPQGVSCASDVDCVDSCVPRSVCVPRVGACRGSGAFCDHCVDDTDCGDATTRSACVEATWDGEYACLDLALPDECPNGLDSECPEAPSGVHGECLNEGEDFDATSWAYEHCYLPYNSTDNRFSCYP